MKKITIILILLSQYCFAQDLSVINTSIPAHTNSIILTADMNNDGWQDIFISGINSGTQYAAIYKNNGDSTFMNLGLPIPTLEDAAACFSDINNDTWLDLIYTGLNSSNNKVFLVFINQKNNTFLPLSHSIPGIRYGSVLTNDFNNNGLQDIFITGYSDAGSVCHLYQNNGDLTFTEISQSFQPVYNGDITSADFNNDGLQDIMYTGYSSSDFKPKFYYYKNIGNHIFTQEINSFPATQKGNLEIADLDNNGYTDIIITGKKEDDNYITQAYINNAGVAFTYQSQVTGVKNGKAKTGDYNNDGFADLFISGEIQSGNFTTELYLNNKSGGFTLETDTLTAVSNSAMSWYNLNNDNKPDIIYSGNSLGSAEIFMLTSNVALKNTFPLPPTNLNTSFSEQKDTVILSWNSATDNETNTTGLSYDFYLYNAISNKPIVTAYANLNSGYRKINKQGNLKSTSISIHNLQEGKYYWSVQTIDAAMEGSAFAQTDTFYISSPFSLGNDTTLCLNDTIHFSYPAVEGTFKWFHSLKPSVPFSTAKETQLSITAKDTIWVEISKPYGDIIKDTIIADIYSLPVVELGEDISSCYGDTIELNTGTINDSVNWYTSSALYTETDTLNFKKAFFSNDEIYAELTDPNTCTNWDTLAINILPLPAINLVSDTTLCLNNSLQLNVGTASDSVNWYSLTNSLEVIDSNTLEYLVSENNTFKVEISNINSCVNYDTINVIARTLPNTNAGNDKLICSGYQTIIGPENINTFWNYSWTGNGILTGQNTANPLIKTSTQTKYYLTVKDEFNCENTDSMQVNINPDGILDAGKNQEICVGSQATIGGNPTAIGSILPYKYQWSPAVSLNNDTIANPVAKPVETTNYTVIIFTGTCPVDTLETTVTVNPLPVINIKNDTIGGFKEDIKLWATGGTIYKWTPENLLDNYLSPNPITNLETTTHFTVEVTDVNNCSDTAGVTIFIKNEVFIPELFTPNNDGNNDTFKIYSFGIKELYLMVINKYGEIVFESKNPDEILNTGWDGTYKGNMVEEGKYFWKIEGQFFNGEPVLFKGKNKGVINILR